MWYLDDPPPKTSTTKREISIPTERADLQLLEEEGDIHRFRDEAEQVPFVIKHRCGGDMMFDADPSDPVMGRFWCWGDMAASTICSFSKRRHEIDKMTPQQVAAEFNTIVTVDIAPVYVIEKGFNGVHTYSYTREMTPDEANAFHLKGVTALRDKLKKRFK